MLQLIHQMLHHLYVLHGVTLDVYFQKHAFATVASVFMPALTPKGSVLFEEGGYYIDGNN